MLLVLHGEAGGWDELLIALVAFGVLWIAVKLAGRKPAADDPDAAQNELAAEATTTPTDDRKDPAAPQPPATKLG
jgi:hypothetical protein